MNYANRERIIPSSRAEWLARRSKNLNSTDISALFGCSPYTTRFELWGERKSGHVVDLELGERARWGTRVQGAIAHGFAEDRGVVVAPTLHYEWIPEHRIGSSYDFEVLAPATPALVECKNVDALMFREGWLVDGDDIEAPPHIELQVQHQLYVSGHELAYIAALVGGNRLAVLERRRDERVINAIKEKAAEFWESIDANRMPEPEFPRDAAAVCKMFLEAEPGKLLDASMNRELARLAREYAEAAQQAKWADQLKETLKAQMLMVIGDHEKVIGDGFKISAGTTTVKASVIERKEYSFRNFRLTFPKDKA